MSAADLESVLRATLGRTIEVRPRRPNTLYQLEMPAFLADGDASAIFVRPEPDGRVLMTDLGKTCMRLSYTRSLTDELLAALDRLAERHGFRLEEGSLISRMPVTQVAAGALGLVQVEAEAEAVIGVAKARGEQARRFRDAARAAVERAFPKKVTFDFALPDDHDQLFKLDAYVNNTRGKSLGLALPANDADAEHAVQSALYIESRLKKKHLLAAVVRDVNDLDPRTRMRLMKCLLVAVPRFDDETDLAKQLKRIAG